ncbi:MAG: outer membrane protein assembly factor BamA [Ignavibacteriae bacterium]|nr:outer membrane protein assembly factor BamA [Ignavibacteriota bacterium]MCB9244306.1 outer membrane protein assembly factor BamA [Ignavibacteriales bacterium]
MRMLNLTSKIFLVLLLGFILLPVVSFAQDGPQTYRIVSITTTGNKLYDSRTIVSYSGLSVGDEIAIPSDASREAIKKLWNLGLFSDISMYIDRVVGNEAYLVIDVKELPRVESVVIKGNKEISTDDLKSRIDIVPGEVVSNQKLKDVEFNLEKYYQEEGYALAEVTVDELISATNEARIRVTVDEGKELNVEKIRFKGNKSISSGDLRGAMENTSEGVWWQFWNSSTFDKKKFQDDIKLIEAYYKERGYKDATVKDYSLDVSPNKEDLTITIDIDEGSKYRLNNVNFTGNEVYKDSLLVSILDMKRGDIYNLRKLQENLYGNENETDISSLYLDRGYLAFNAETEEKVVDGNKIDLTIKITENNQFRIGLVGFEGNEKTRDKVLRRELYSIPGDYFTKTSVKRSLQQLNSLNYFNPEKLTQQIIPANDSTVNITYVVEERSSDQFNASVGYSASFGFTGSLGLTFNNFDLARPLSGGAGQILNFNWQFGESGTYRTFAIGFTEPWLYGTPTLLGLNLFDTRTNYNSIDIQETGGYLSLGRRFKFPDDYFRGDWVLKFQRTDTKSGAGIYEEGTRSQFSLRQTITRSTVFDPVFPTSGTRVSNSTELAAGPLIGNIGFIKNIFTTETYTRIFRDNSLTLYSTFNFSFINSITTDNYLPPNEVFFMGGNGLTYNTIALRGYDDRTIGPKNSSGTAIGGTVALKYGLELRYPLSLDPLPVFILAFAEAGNIWSSFQKTDPFNLRRSVGGGVRLLLPAVGMIGFDMGYGIDRLAVDGQQPEWLFHFQFGRGF